jgi:antitoxin MazE
MGEQPAVRLPKKLVDELGLKPGDELDVVAVAGRHIEVEKNQRREQALAAIKARRWSLPEGNRFDHEEANKR